MAFTVIIPARLASTRLPNKPLADIAGKPMVIRVAERARLSQANQVVVATDSPLIQEACQAHGVSCVMTSEHHPSGSDRLAEACEKLLLHGDDVVVNVQGDEPLIDPELINQVANLLMQHAGCPMSTAAHPIKSVSDYLNPNVVKVVCNADGKASYFSRSPIPCWRDAPKSESGQPDQLPDPGPLQHVGIYGYRADFLKRFIQLPAAPTEKTESLEQLRALWHGFPIAVYQSQAPAGVGVDTPQDLEQVRRLFQAQA